MKKENYQDTRSRATARRSAIEESSEDFDEGIRKAGKEILERYVSYLEKRSGYGSDFSEKLEQTFSWISEKIRKFSIDEREMIFGDFIANISEALKAIPSLDAIEWNAKGTKWWVNHPWIQCQVFEFFEKQLEQGDISSAGAVFRNALHQSQSSAKKGHVIRWLFAQDSDYERFPFAEKASDEMGDEIVENLLEQKEYALVIENHRNFHLSYEQSKQCIKELLRSEEGTAIQDAAILVHPRSTHPFADAIKDIWLPQLSLDEYKTFLKKYIDLHQKIKPLFIDNARLLQCKFASWEHTPELRYAFQGPEVNDDAFLHIISQLFDLEDVQRSKFYTPERIRAFVKNHPVVDFSFEDKFLHDATNAKIAALQFPWLMQSTKEWLRDLQQMTPERKKEMEEQMQTLPENQRAGFTEEFAQQGIIGSLKEREATLKNILKNVPPDHQESVKKSFYEKGITDGQMERWLGYHAFKVPEDWDPKIVGKIMFCRLQQGVSNNMHEASYFLSHFGAPEELQGEDSETKKRKKTYNSVAQKWLNNYVSTPAETLILAWQNRDAALDDGCADNPGAIVQWTKLNNVRRLLEQYGQSTDTTDPTEQAKIAFLAETVRCASPEETRDMAFSPYITKGDWLHNLCYTLIQKFQKIRLFATT